MGLHPIRCSKCTEVFMWYSGNHLDQRCQTCRNTDTVLGHLNALSAALDQMTDAQLEALISGSGITDEQAKQYSRLEKAILDEKMPFRHLDGEPFHDPEEE